MRARNRPAATLLLAMGLALGWAGVHPESGRADQRGAPPIGAEAAFSGLEVGDRRITELAFPVGISFTLGDLELAANTAYSRARVVDSAGTAQLAGPTDLTVRLAYPVLADRLRAIVGANLPTGRATLHGRQEAVAAEIATELFGLPVAGFGSGLGVTTALAGAQQLGDWVVGVSGAYRAGRGYEPFRPTTAQPTLEFRQAHELRLRAALERHTRTGWSLSGAVAWSTFAADRLDGSDYFEPGDRLLGEISVEAPVGSGAAAFYVWDLYRERGRLIGAALGDGRPGLALAELDRRNLVGAGGRMSLPVSNRLSLRPAVEFLAQHTAGADSDDPGAADAVDGYIVRAGGGVAVRAGGWVLEPAALGQVGRLAGDRVIGLTIRGGVAWAR